MFQIIGWQQFVALKQKMPQRWEEDMSPRPVPRRKPVAPAAASKSCDRHENENAKLFLSNLSFDITEEVIKKIFKDCGTITDLFWLKSKKDGRFLGKMFITFETVDQARLAYTKKDEEVMGRSILIDYARPREKKVGGRGGRGGRESRQIPCQGVYHFRDRRSSSTNIREEGRGGHGSVNPDRLRATSREKRRRWWRSRAPAPVLAPRGLHHNSVPRQPALQK